MSRLADFDHRIQEYASAKETAGALADINALRMQAIRGRFEKNQRFFDEIRALYGVVRSGAAEETADASHPKGTLYIAVTANRRFAGSLVRDTIDALARELAAHPDAACIVVGRLGWFYFDALGLAQRGRQILFAGEAPTPSELAALMAYTEHYEHVLVLYGKFVNAFRQEVAMQDITDAPEEGGEPAEAYLFEPEVGALSTFFDAQVRYILFERVLLESDLARTAARFVTMEESRDRAAERLKAEERGRLRAQAAASNASLLETLSGYGRWQHDDHD